MLPYDGPSMPFVLRTASENISRHQPTYLYICTANDNTEGPSKPRRMSPAPRCTGHLSDHEAHFYRAFIGL